MKHYKTIKKCRLCESKKLSQTLSFGKVPLGNNLLYNQSSSLRAKKYPLGLQNCNRCNHYQLSHEVNPKLLYATNYSYLTGVGKSFIKHFKDYVPWIENKCKLSKGDKILDVGSNDGTCLKFFKKNNYKVVGIDPAKMPATKANKSKIKTYNIFFNDRGSEILLKKEGKFDFITSHNVFAHISDLRSVFKNIFKLLSDGGHLCFEVGYFLKVVQNNLFDTIYHEHLDYHHAAPLVKLLRSQGFSIISLTENEVQGGSLRVLCRKDNLKKISYSANLFLEKESKFFKKNKIEIKKWKNTIENSMKKFEEIIKKYYMKKYVISAYGAPTKATLLLKLANLSSHKYLNCIVEDNKLKIGRHIPGTKIKIVDFKYFKENKPNILIVLAWNFIDDIKAQLIKKKVKGILIVVPLPKIRKILI